MNPTIDVLNFMVPTGDFMKSFHLASSTPAEGAPTGTANQILTWRRRETTRTGWIYYVKTNSGFPWDIYYYDSNQVYWVITPDAASWTDPSAYQLFTSVSWPQGRGGIAWCPRFVEEPPWLGFLTTADTTYNQFQGGQQVSIGNLDAPGVALVQGPYSLPVGRLGQQSVIIQSYQSGQSMEVNWYAQGLGKVRRQLYNETSGIYQLQEDATFDQRLTGGSIEPVFRGELPGPGPLPPPNVVVLVNPPGVTLFPGGTQQFTATVTGISDQSVTWSLQPGTPGVPIAGTISAIGLYRAPATLAQTSYDTVVATSVSYPSSSNEASVTIALPTIVILVSPQGTTVNPGGTQQFTATVQGITDQSVTWSLVTGTPGQPVVGSINATSGLYTAPATVAITSYDTVLATSVPYPSAQGVGSITIPAGS
jgi:hypothetical protein